jgi:hypothetical protein
MSTSPLPTKKGNKKDWAQKKVKKTEPERMVSA